MHRTRSKELGQLIVQKKDLEAIWTILKKYYNADFQNGRESQKQDSSIWLPDPPAITVRSTGSMTTTDSTDAIFQNDVIDLQKSASVKFRYTTLRPVQKTIEIDLMEGGSTILNSFSVNGNDPAWVDATYLELERVFNSVSPQSQLFRRYRFWITFALALAIGRSFQLFLDIMLPPANPAPKPPDWAMYLVSHPSLLFIIGCIGAWLVGISPAMLITSWAAKLWPSIEFDFGPEHMKTAKAVRTRVGTIVALLVLPLLLTAFQRIVLHWR